MNKFVQFSFPDLLSTFLFFFCTSWQLDTFNSISISCWGLHDLQDSSSLMLSMLLNWMLRPVCMGSQDSVQELLRDRLAPSLLWRDSCCMNQCFPLVLLKNRKYTLYTNSWKLVMGNWGGEKLENLRPKKVYTYASLVWGKTYKHHKLAFTI